MARATAATATTVGAGSGAISVRRHRRRVVPLTRGVGVRARTARRTDAVLSETDVRRIQGLAGMTPARSARAEGVRTPAPAGPGPPVKIARGRSGTPGRIAPGRSAILVMDVRALTVEPDPGVSARVERIVRTAGRARVARTVRGVRPVRTGMNGPVAMTAEAGTAGRLGSTMRGRHAATLARGATTGHLETTVLAAITGHIVTTALTATRLLVETTGGVTTTVRCAMIVARTVPVRKRERTAPPSPASRRASPGESWTRTPARSCSV